MNLKVNGVSLESGDSTPPLLLVEGGVTALSTQVLAQDNITTKTYIVNARRISIDPTLFNIEFSFEGYG